MSASPPQRQRLWSEVVLASVCGGDLCGRLSGPITGVSIDTRAIEAGDLFVALKDQRDGHDFVTQAFSAGATAALVAKAYQRRDGDGALIRVDDPLRALEDAGRVARFRTDAKVAAVTGSVGKTGTKEMLRLCLGRVGATHASEKSYNNHWGVPLTLARMPADPKRTYGYRRVEVLAALGNAIALMVATGFLLREAWARFMFPTTIAAGPMIAVALVGLICNLISASMLWRVSRNNINLRGALLHVLSDGAGSVGAVLAGVIMLKTRWYQADALVTVLICVGIVFTAFWLLRDSVHILLEGTPAHLDVEEVRGALAAIPGVADVHDLHLWCLTMGQDAMSGHLILADGHDPARALKDGKAVLADRFGITHVTLQIETKNDA